MRDVKMIKRSAPVGGKDVPTALPLGGQLYSTNSNIGKALDVSASKLIQSWEVPKFQ
jgi:hypothetical protein